MTSVNPINLPTTLQIDSKGNCHDYEQIELKQMNVHIPVNEDVEKESRIYSIKFYSMKQKIDASIGFNHNDKTVVIKSNDLEICKISFLDILGAKELAELNKTLIDTHLIELAFFPKILSKGCCFFCNCKKGSKCCDTKTERNLKKIFFETKQSDNLFHLINKLALGDCARSLEIAFKRRFLVFVNPYGGSGKALKVWESVKDIITSAHIEVTLVKTQYHKHAYDYMLKENLSNVDGIICVSGDGIVHEAINALMHRKDKEATRIPLGHIPAGSGNGLAKTVTSASNEDYTPQNAAYIICKGQTKSLDLMELEFVTQTKENFVYAFHSLSWGLVSDVGFESEVLRCCGGARFDICGLWRICCMCTRKYFTSMYTLKTTDLVEEIPKLNEAIKDGDHFDFYKGEIKSFYIINLPWPTEKVHGGPNTKFDDGLFDIFMFKSSKCQFLKILSNPDLSIHFKDGALDPKLNIKYTQTNLMRIYPKHSLNDPDDLNCSKPFPRFYNVDGERYKVEPVQLRMKPRATNVFCLMTNY